MEYENVLTDAILAKPVFHLKVNDEDEDDEGYWTISKLLADRASGEQETDRYGSRVLCLKMSQSYTEYIELYCNTPIHKVWEFVALRRTVYRKKSK